MHNRSHRINRFLGAILLIMTIGSCSSGNVGLRHIDPNSWINNIGINVGNFDNSRRPQDDFYGHVNGRWIDSLSIPPDRAIYGAFSQLAEQAEIDIARIIIDIANNDRLADDSDAAKIRNLYISFADILTIENKGIAPITPMLEEINNIRNEAQLSRHFARLVTMRMTSPVSLSVSPDAGDASQNALYIAPSGLAMPERHYYLRNDPSAERIKDSFLVYVTRLFDLLGFEDSRVRAQAVIAFETRLAEAHAAITESRDRVLGYNPVTLADLVAASSIIDWQAYFDTLGLTGEPRIVIRQPSYLVALDQIIEDTGLGVVKDYLRFHLVDNLAEYLPTEFDQAYFDFYQGAIRGTQQRQPRENRAVSFVNIVMAEPLGQIFVGLHFNRDTRARVSQMAENIKAAFGDRIDRLDWMTDETKREARRKLSQFRFQIGHPSSWPSYAALDIDAGDLIGNVLRYGRFMVARDLAKLSVAVDRNEWSVPAQQVNAYYSAPLNQIYLPAAILRPPFFNEQVDDAINYGAIGAVIGHEIIHGFDDQGRKSDGDGNLRDWWYHEDEVEFDIRAQRLSTQYSALEPLPGLFVDGQQTLGENIGDLGGVSVAYDAYVRSLGGGRSQKVLGFTGEQRFFLGWAQIWRRVYRPEEMRRRLLSDTHALGRYRVNKVLSNLPEFYAAFGVVPGDRLFVPEDERVAIW
jgi:putative endopeptidase